MNKENKFKKAKFEEEIKELISSFIRKNISDTRLSFVSITKVELNGDYSVATVYWDTFNTTTRGDSKKAIEGITGKVRHHLSTVLKVRQTPIINFIYDAQYESEQKITRILEEENKRNALQTETLIEQH
ncbi:MAG: 30S ribosome-binding factor RbfA [Oligoflexia bacterium]|nr:30S ribosome-binding factor RbfA [Oligoflexia bacterium]